MNVKFVIVRDDIDPTEYSDVVWAIPEELENILRETVSEDMGIGDKFTYKVYRLVETEITVDAKPRISGVQAAIGINLSECPKCQSAFYKDGEPTEHKHGKRKAKNPKVRSSP